MKNMNIISPSTHTIVFFVNVTFINIITFASLPIQLISSCLSLRIPVYLYHQLVLTLPSSLRNITKKRIPPYLNFYLFSSVVFFFLSSLSLLSLKSNVPVFSLQLSLFSLIMFVPVLFVACSSPL